MGEFSTIRVRIGQQAERAKTDPASALVHGRHLLDEIPQDDHYSRSSVLRSLSIACRTAGTLPESITYAEDAVAEARATDDEELMTRALMTLSGSLTIAGRNHEALQMIEEAQETADSELLQARVRFQRGAILLRLGDPKAARALYSDILPILARHEDVEFQRMALSNRALARRFAGDLQGARSDLLGARELYERDGIELEVAYTDHNLGWVALDMGDIPEALGLLDASEAALAKSLSSVSEVQVSRCEALLAAGLVREAQALAFQIAEDMGRSGLREDEAEARLLAAQAALLAGDLKQAVSLAGRAAVMFADQRRDTWRANALLVSIQVRYEAGDQDRRLISEARQAARVLDRQGQHLGVLRARLVAGLIGARSGDGDQGVSDLRWVAQHARGPIETRLQGRLAAAVLRLGEGDRRGANAAAQSGMRVLDDFQAALGATDVRMGVERHGRELGNLGLRLALESRDPRRCFRWMELRRGRALMFRPVTPPADERMAEEVAELRYVAAELRHAVGHEAVMLVRRQQRMQSTLRDRARVVRGGGRTTRRPDPVTVASALGDATVVEMAALDDVLWAVTIQGNRFRLVEIGPAPEVARESESLRFAMRRLAQGRGSEEVAQSMAARLDSLLFGPLPVRGGPLIIVPTPALHALPWWALPTCRSRPVTISPSAELWYRARASSPSGSGVIIAAGPDLDLSDAEVRAVARLYSGCRLLSSARASVQRVQAILDGATMAHIASHASFQFENPMFSSLRLADGDLYVYDIERLEAAPDIVVLSACDSGFTDTHPGEELMGLSSALLSMGTRSIIASVGLVPDSQATKALMVALHHGLISGLSPAVALHRAQAKVGSTPEGYVAAASFICIGAG